MSTDERSLTKNTVMSLMNETNTWCKLTRVYIFYRSHVSMTKYGSKLHTYCNRTGDFNFQIELDWTFEINQNIIFMVTPCIDDIKHFNVSTRSHSAQHTRLTGHTIQP
jgi:hypothetical protein